MAKYFHIMSGLRGAYVDGNARVVRCETRRELKAELASECAYWRDAGYIGGARRTVATIAADAWRDARSKRPRALPVVIPLAPSHARTSYSYGVMVSTATRREYVDAMKEESI